MNRQRCICMFSTRYAPNVGGVESYTEHLARTLVRLGIRVIVVTSNTHGLESRTSESGFDVVRLPCRNLLGGRYPVPQRNAEYRRLVSWLEAQAIDCVVVHARFYPHSLEGLALADRLGASGIVVEHGSAHLTMGHTFVDLAVRAVEHAMTRRVMRHRPRFFAVSRKASAWLGHFGIASSGELPNAIDADAFASLASERDFASELHLEDDAFIVAFAGRLVPEKGALALARAIASLEKEEGAPVCALIAGAGPESHAIEALGCKRVHALGKLSREDLAALLHRADAMALPSRSEGFATALLEAAACKTPAIVTAVGGTDELIPDQRFGVLLADARPETVAQALRKAAGNRALTASQGEAAYRRAKDRCSWDETARLLLEAVYGPSRNEADQ